MAKREINTGNDEPSVADELKVREQELEQRLALSQAKIDDLQAMLMAVSKQPDVPPTILADARNNIALGFDEGDAFEIAVRAYMIERRQTSTTSTIAKAS